MAPYRLLVLAAVALLPYVAALPNDLVWDDKVILEQRLQPELVSGVLQLWTEPYWGDRIHDTFRPLSLTVLYLERKSFGGTVWAYHCVNLALHICVCLLVFRLANRIASPATAWVAALLFAAHPVHSEAVAMVYGQLELLAALFVLLALEAYVHASRAGWIAGVALAFCAYCSKESALMLPALALLVRRSWGALLFLAPAACYLALRWPALGGVLISEETLTHGFGTMLRIKATAIALGEYLRLSILPTGQSLYYGHLRDALLGVPWVAAGWLVAAAIFCRALATEVGDSPVRWSAGWWLLGLLPVLNLIPGGVLVAERALYLPVFGVALLAARVYTNAFERRSVLRWAPVFLVLAEGIASVHVVRQWRDEETLWRSTIAAHPRSPMAHVWLGQAVLAKSQDSRHLTEADLHFQQALQLNPELVPAMRGRAVVAAAFRDCTSALWWAEEARRRAADAEPDAAVSQCGGSPQRYGNAIP